jgi:hypothetical protein
MALFWGSAACSSESEGENEVEKRCETFCELAHRGSVCDIVGIVEYCRDGHCECVAACSRQTIREMPVGKTCDSQVDAWNECATRTRLSCSAATLDSCVSEAAAVDDCNAFSGS